MSNCTSNSNCKNENLRSCYNCEATVCEQHSVKEALSSSRKEILCMTCFESSWETATTPPPRTDFCSFCNIPPLSGEILVPCHSCKKDVCGKHSNGVRLKNDYKLLLLFFCKECKEKGVEKINSKQKLHATTIQNFAQTIQVRSVTIHFIT